MVATPGVVAPVRVGIRTAATGPGAVRAVAVRVAVVATQEAAALRVVEVSGLREPVDLGEAADETGTEGIHIHFEAAGIGSRTGRW